jgi:outer membrane protein assembly factor BamB
MPGPGPAEPVGVVWQAEVGGLLLGAPAVVDGVLYAAGGDYEDSEPAASVRGIVVALDAATGAEHWRVETIGHVSDSPAVVDGVVYVGTNAGRLLALDAATGAERWQIDLGGRVYVSSPAIAGGLLFINTGAVSSSPAVADGLVYVGGGPGRVGGGESVTIAVGIATGAERWRVMTRESGFYALDATSGAQRWFVATDVLLTNSVAVAAGIAYFVDGTGGVLLAVDAASGQPRWQVVLDGWALYASPAVSDGVVYVVDMLGYLYAFDASHGTERWRFAASGASYLSPVIAGDLYLADRVGNVTAVDSVTGQERWTAATGGQVTGPDPGPSPVVVDGLLYISRADGVLVAAGQVATDPGP